MTRNTRPLEKLRQKEEALFKKRELVAKIRSWLGYVRLENALKN